MAFDDGPDAFLSRLTSFNFNGSAAIHAMLDWILRPPSGRGRDMSRLDFEGFVTERATTAAAIPAKPPDL